MLSLHHFRTTFLAIVVSVSLLSGYALTGDSFSAGMLDPEFGETGKTTTALGGTSSDRATAIVAQSDGKMVAVGVRSINGSNDSVIIRYNSDGSLDSSFDSDGILILPISTSGDEMLSMTEHSQSLCKPMAR